MATFRDGTVGTTVHGDRTCETQVEFLIASFPALRLVAAAAPWHMAYDENQIFLPDSFLALYLDRRQRLTASKEAVLTSYGLCEDMAQMLVDHCRNIQQVDHVDERQVLERCYAGLVASESTFAPPQAQWVIRRTAELLDWQYWVEDFPGDTAER